MWASRVFLSRKLINVPFEFCGWTDICSQNNVLTKTRVRRVPELGTDRRVDDFDGGGFTENGLHSAFLHNWWIRQAGAGLWGKAAPSHAEQASLHGSFQLGMKETSAVRIWCVCLCEDRGDAGVFLCVCVCVHNITRLPLWLWAWKMHCLQKFARRPMWWWWHNKGFYSQYSSIVQ